MKKILAFIPTYMRLGDDDFRRLQGHCFGVALFDHLKTQFPNHPSVKKMKNKVTTCQRLQRAYIYNKEHARRSQESCFTFITLTGIKEVQYQGSRLTRDELISWINTQPSFEDSETFPNHFMYYFSVTAQEGHFVSVNLYPSQALATIVDSQNQDQVEYFPIQTIHQALFNKIDTAFIKVNPGQENGMIDTQVVKYELNENNETVKRKRNHV